MKAVAFLLWCFALCLALLEVTLRIITPADALKVHWLNNTHYEFYPDYEGTFYDVPYHIDSQGFRVTKHNPKADKSVLLLGDSMMFGSGVEDKDTIASYLTEIFSNKNIPLQVINAAIPSYTTTDYFLRLQRALELLPQNQIIVCSIFSKNDFEEFLITKEKENEKFSLLLKKNSRAFALLYSLLEGQKRTNQIERIETANELLLGESDFARHTIADALSYLPKMEIVARAKNNQIVFLYIPYVAQVSEDINTFYQTIKTKPGLPPKVTKEFLKHKTREIFLRFCEDQNLLCIDATELFEHSPYALTHHPGQKTQEVVVDAATGHFSKEGSRLMADFLYEKLEHYFTASASASS